MIKVEGLNQGKFVPVSARLTLACSGGREAGFTSLLDYLARPR